MKPLEKFLAANSFAHIFLALAFCAAAIGTEFRYHWFEKGAGHFLKWQNPKRQQLGRIWEKERENAVAQSRVQSVMSTLLARERDMESLPSLDALFNEQTPSLLLSREKFLRLYLDFPDRAAQRLVSQVDLLQMDARTPWERVLVTREEAGYRVSFLTADNVPVHEAHVDAELLREIRKARSVVHGGLESAGFARERIFPVELFISVMSDFDSATREDLFADSKWLLKNGFRIQRVGISAASAEPDPGVTRFGIEYANDFSREVIVTPIAPDIAAQLLSRIEEARLTEKNGMAAVDEAPLLPP